jgi:hypothetical protein
VRVKLHDIVAHQGIDYRVGGIVDYRLDGRVLRLAHLVAGREARFLDLPADEATDRLPLLAEIEPLAITAPPPATIYHHGESFLLKLSGEAAVAITGDVPGRAPGTCTLWRYRAAGGRILQIEAWPDAVRMLEGASVHPDMIEIRPARLLTS